MITDFVSFCLFASFCSLGPHAKKFNIVSNDHGRTHKHDFSVFERKFPFWANWSTKNKIVSLSSNLVPRLIRICRFNSGIYFFRFWLKLPILCKFDPKKQNCQFKLKFGIWTNSNIQNSMVLVIFSVLDQKHPFWGNLD